MSEKKKQFFPPETIRLTEEAFEDHGNTELYWLSSAGMMINSHGTIILVDPSLVLIGEPPMSEFNENFRVVRRPPFTVDEIPRVDYVLYTHADLDHMAPLTLRELNEKTDAFFVGSQFCVSRMQQAGVKKERCLVHEYGDIFRLDGVKIVPTIADHAWMIDRPDEAERQFGIRNAEWHYGPKDCCGYKFITPEGVIWHPGDTVFHHEHLTMTDVDVMFFDVGDDIAHFQTRNAIRIYEHLKQTDMILYHYGTYDAPDVPYANGSPADIEGKVSDMSRLKVLAPGEKYIVKNNH